MTGALLFQIVVIDGNRGRDIIKLTLMRESLMTLG